MKLLPIFVFSFAAVSAYPSAIIGQEHNHHGSIGPAGVVTREGASGPSGVVTAHGTSGPTGHVTAQGAIGPKGEHSSLGWIGKASLALGHGISGLHTHGPLAASGVVITQGVTGPSGVVSSHGTSGPAGTVNGYGAVGPNGVHSSVRDNVSQGWASHGAAAFGHGHHAGTIATAVHTAVVVPADHGIAHHW